MKLYLLKQGIVSEIPKLHISNQEMYSTGYCQIAPAELYSPVRCP